MEINHVNAHVIPMLCYCSSSFFLLLLDAVILSMENVKNVYTKKCNCHKNLSSAEAKKNLCGCVLKTDKQINFMLC